MKEASYDRGGLGTHSRLVRKKRVRYIIDDRMLSRPSGHYRMQKRAGIIAFFVLVTITGLGFLAWLISNAAF